MTTCPLCGDSLDPVAGVDHNWVRIVYRTPGGPWRACRDGVSFAGVTLITLQRESQELILYYRIPEVPEIVICVEPTNVERQTAHATCAEELIAKANAA